MAMFTTTRIFSKMPNATQIIRFTFPGNRP